MAKTPSNNPPPPNKKNSAPDSSATYSKLKIPAILLTVFILWFGHYSYLFTLFENDRFFSHLSDMEREMSFRTEMGLYFSYYKTLVEAPSFIQGLHLITNDNVTEAGHTINTLQRFNLYPEVYLSALFRVFRHINNHFKIEWQSCFRVRRGSDLPPVESCEGIGNPHYFYVHGAFLIAGSVLSTAFLLGYVLSQSYFGGMLSVVAFMVNHGHATRAQWTPPLRESFGYPVFFLQICLISWILGSQKICKWTLMGLVFLTTHFILFWQFSGFVLFTQIICIFCTYTLEYLPVNKLRALIFHYMISFVISFGLLFGNLMLLSSLFFTSLISVAILIVLRRLLTEISNKMVFLMLNLVLCLFLAILIKFSINNFAGIHDDSHVFDILRSKFTSYSNFHTSLYTCAAEFDYIDAETLRSISKTGLLPLATLSLLYVSVVMFKNLLTPPTNEPNSTTALAPVIFNSGQVICFCLMAVLIMRLKLFAVPHLCVFLPVVFNQDVQQSVLKRHLSWTNALIFVYIGILAFQGQQNIKTQLSIRGEFNNEAQEKLFRWVMENTDKDAVFSGSMAVMANLKLSTMRPIFNHPHYEDEGIRERTIKAYSIYSRRNPAEVYRLLKSLGINYFVFEPHNCGEHSRPGCSYLGMWDKIDPNNRERPSICSQFIGPIEEESGYEKLLPFEVVYNSYNYVVFKI